jgi:rSAM/selenodomain-associated transferase 1
VRDLLLVFLRWPEPGATKTRLIPALGAEGAARLYRILAETEMEATRPREHEYQRLLCFAPQDAGERMEGWFPGEDFWAQPEGDLGRRMASAFDEGFRRGAKRVALVGSDVPWVSRDLVTRSFEALAAADVVLGPARDGGYYLMALSGPQPELFLGVEWSTPRVLAVTRARAVALGLETHLVEPMDDIDALEDIRVTWKRLEPLLAIDPALRQEVAHAIRGR